MIKYGVTVLVGLLIGAGLIWAQAATPEVTPESDPCSYSALQAAKDEIDQLFVEVAAEDSAALLGALYEAGQRYQETALTCGYLPDDLQNLIIGTQDLELIMTALETLSGDPLRGQLLYNGEEQTADGVALGCGNCHEQGAVAPMTEGTWTRWDEQRQLEPQFADYSFERYMAESIILPWDYFVPEYPQFTMPDIYHDQLSYQDLADIIAFLESQDQLP
ncbi:MAG: hypothetical protein MUF87_10475 [Anaerolineae bacterium]|jgi:hypothetical protein|nr:hypothetical protein [Anaerolineae bacterium]